VTSAQLRELQEELRAFVTDVLDERGNVAATLALIDSPAPCSRGTFTPGHLTASGFVINIEARRVLLHHHRRLGRWLQMGGHIEPDESPASAALRESREESGIEDLTLVTGRIFDVDVHLIPAGRGEPEHRHFDLRYVISSPLSSGEVIAPAESVELGWFTFDEAIARMNSPESRRSIMKIEQMFRRGGALPRP
jgi:8-oxo-dGTP pyrophosphatase MutT (NUDIX family)